MVKGSVKCVRMESVTVDLCQRHDLNEVGHHMEVQIWPHSLHVVKQAAHDLGLTLVIEAIIWTDALR